MTADPSRPLRIFVHDYSGHPFQIQLSRWLAKQGHRVHHVYSADFESPHGTMERTPDDSDEFQIIALSTGKALPKYSLFRRLLQEIHYSRLVTQAIHQTSPDVVISGNAQPYIQAAMIFASHRRGIRFVYWLQDIYNLGIEREFKARFGSWAKPITRAIASFEYAALRSSDHVIAITNDFLPILDKHGIDVKKTSVIENWATLEDIPEFGKANEWSRARGWEDKFVFLYTGTLGLKHNPELLVQLATTFQDDPDVLVAVASQGLGRQYLETEKKRLCLRNLELGDFLPFKEIPVAMASSDVLLALLETHASEFAVPSKVLTYLCAARPILSSIPPENLAARLISGVPAGINTRPGDTEAFLLAAKTLRSQASERTLQFGRSARSYAERNFSIAAIGAKFLEICTLPRG